MSENAVRVCRYGAHPIDPQDRWVEFFSVGPDGEKVDVAFACAAHDVARKVPPSTGWEASHRANGPVWTRERFVVRRCTGAQPGAAVAGWYVAAGLPLTFHATAREAMRHVDVEAADAARPA